MYYDSELPQNLYYTEQTQKAGSDNACQTSASHFNTYFSTGKLNSYILLTLTL